MEKVIDSRQVDAILQKLANPQTVADILNHGVEQMAEVYYRSVLQSLQGKMGSGATSVRKDAKYANPLIQGVKKHVKEDGLYKVYGVHGLGDFRLRFFEGGTKGRWTKGTKITGQKQVGRRYYNTRTGKPAYRGMITANHFFQEGIQMSENTANQALTQTILEQLRAKNIPIT